MGQASSVGLPSLWQLLPHGFGGAAALDREVNKPTAAESSFPTRERTEAGEQRRPFNHHVHLSDVVSPMNGTRERSAGTVANDGLHIFS